MSKNSLNWVAHEIGEASKRMENWSEAKRNAMVKASKVSHINKQRKDIDSERNVEIRNFKRA